MVELKVQLVFDKVLTQLNTAEYVTLEHLLYAMLLKKSKLFRIWHRC